jgi:hypothetical protein
MCYGCFLIQCWGAAGRLLDTIERNWESSLNLNVSFDDAENIFFLINEAKVLFAQRTLCYSSFRFFQAKLFLIEDIIIESKMRFIIARLIAE